MSSNKDLKKSLTKLQYHVTLEHGTEAPFSGELNDCKEEGIYKCVCCDSELFISDSKFDSGTGWPSFFDCINKDKIDFKEDSSHMMVRIEVSCKKCGAHLGHVFSDGPEPTGLRFCINSCLLYTSPSPRDS